MTINGTTVSALAVYGYTAADVANALTNAINSNPNLSPIVTASKTGNSVRVTSRTTGIEYSYPWHTRCTFNQLAGFTECAFTATLGPAATLHPDAP
jgi:phage tail sheath gpL-like